MKNIHVITNYNKRLAAKLNYYYFIEKRPFQKIIRVGTLLICKIL